MSDLPLRVLIVGDHASFRSAARALLERRGCSVVGEADGTAVGIDAAWRIAPDAVLLDVRLRDGDGFEVSRAMSRRDPGLAVAMAP
jgi:two-component system response regulator EvgA